MKGLQNFRNSWSSCSGPLSLLFYSFQSHFPVLTEDLETASGGGIFQGTFLPLQVSSSDSCFRKTFQVPIILQCSFYAVRTSLYPTRAQLGASSRKHEALTEHGRRGAESYGYFPGPSAFMVFLMLFFLGVVSEDSLMRKLIYFLLGQF